MKVKLLSHVQLFATPWTAVYQAPPSIGFSRQEYWSGLPLSSPTEGQWYSNEHKQNHIRIQEAGRKMDDFGQANRSVCHTQC